jgi:hypothetical protein
MRASSNALALLLATSTALGQATSPTAADKATARALLDAGDALAQQNDHRGALAKYQAADAIMGVPTTGIAVAQTQAKLGMLVEAADSAARVHRFEVRADEPDAFSEARTQAASLLADVTLRMPTLTVKIAGVESPSADVRVLVDGEELRPATRFVPRKVNPGKHQIAVIQGKMNGSATIELAERATTIAEITLREGAALAPPSPPRSANALLAPTQPPQESRPPTNPGVWIGLGVAGAATVAGAITGAFTLASKPKLALECGADRQCATPKSQDALDRSYRLANASTACFVVAGAGGIVALTAWLVTRNPKRPDARAHVVIAPWHLGYGGTF